MRSIILLAAALVPLAAPAEERRPNFVFIFTDDQRHDAMGVVQREQGERGRFPWLKTPNMDRLAAEGVRFRNAFVVHALCSPSRASFLTGQYPHRHGIVNNRGPFPADTVTHATLLRKAGYTTGYCGKWHMGPEKGKRPGFDFSASFVGQGRYNDCPFEVNGVVTPSKGWVDDNSTDYAIDFLTMNKDKTFSLVVGFKSSHGPFEPPERLKGELTDAVSKLPVNGAALPPYLDKPAAPPRPGAREAMQRNYFRTLMGADENLGRLLKTLDDLKLAHNTVVIYSSDNGFYLADHGLGDKRSAYEESIRIPLLLRFPLLGLKGKTIDQMALNIDLAPTLLELAGVAVPKEMQGRSWLPLLKGEAKDWRTSFFYEYFYDDPFKIPTCLAVRTESAKLIKWPGHDEWTELYDLKNDPYEMKNLFKDPAQAELRKKMEDEYDRQAKAVEFRMPKIIGEYKK